LFEGYLAKQPLVEVYDSVLSPALAMAEIHWHLDEVDERHHNFILQGMKDMIQNHHERQQELGAEKLSEPAITSDSDRSLANQADSQKLVILCVPARSEADEISCSMLMHVLEMQGCRVQAIAAKSTDNELLDSVEQRHADVVCISSTPPAAGMHARRLCKLLRTRFPRMTLVVSLCDVEVDLIKIKERIGCGATVVATLTEAQAFIRQIKPSKAPDEG